MKTSQIQVYDSIRKPLPAPTRIFRDKKRPKLKKIIRKELEES